MKVYFHTLGCKVNQYETESMTELFKGAGYELAENPEDADVVIVNSCTVTAVSDKKSRQAVRHFKQIKPSGVVILTGCMPQAYPEQAKNLVEADIVAGNSNHREILNLVEEYFARDLENQRLERLFHVEEHERDESFENIPIDAFEGRTRAFIKIQDGCNRFCSYCIIPTARGRSRSRSLENLKEELVQLKEAGFKEVVLVGINFCCYGLDIGKSFVDPIALACDLGFERVRIGSLEFDNITDEAIDELAKLPNFCPQFHMSLQSGCDKTLKNMHRHYTTEEYEALCNKLRQSFPDATITTDIMVGFPEETEEDFETSLAFARRIGFEKIHVFPYSARTGTLAAKKPQISKTIKTQRAKRMSEAAEEIQNAFLEKQIGKVVEVLTEQYHNGFVTGHTKNYTAVRYPAPEASSNELVQVRITGYEKGECIGEKI